MESVSMRVFAFPAAERAYYPRLLAAEADFRLVRDGESFQVGIFDNQLPSLKAMLSEAQSIDKFMRPLLISPDCNENECVCWMSNGVWGVVPYERRAEELVRAVRQVADGQLRMPPAVVLRWMLMEHAAQLWARWRLTWQENQVMRLAELRLSNKEIGNLLRITERTVKFHMSNIFSKLGVTSRRQLLRLPT